jgi:RNA polymerase sigma factor (sigma-70 family)
MSSRFAGKGACALCSARVTNIRLWPSLRVDIGATNGPKPKFEAVATASDQTVRTSRRLLRAAPDRHCDADRMGLTMATSKRGARVAGIEPPLETKRDFDDVFRAEAPRLQRFLGSQLRDDEEARDLTQETFFRFLRSPTAIGIANPQAYLRTIAKNLLRDRFANNQTKMSQASVSILEGLDAMDSFDQHRAIVGRQELSDWEAIFEQLKPTTLEVFLLARVDGFTYEEIARRLDLTTRMVKRHMQKAIAHIAKHRGSR